MRDVLTALGTVWLCAILGTMAWCAACECSERVARRRCEHCDRLDVSTDWLAFQCEKCGRRVKLGKVRKGSNRVPPRDGLRAPHSRR